MKMTENVFRGTGGKIDLLNTLYGGSSQTTINVERKDSHLLITLSAAGLKASAFNVLVEGDKLVVYTLLVDNSDHQPEEDSQRLAVPMFMRVLDIPAFVDADQIEAVHEQGRVVVTLPFKDEEHLHRRIDIKNLF